MAKRSAKRVSQRPYDDDDFNDNDIMEDDLNEEEDFDDDFEERNAEEESEEEEAPKARKTTKKRASSRKHSAEPEVSKGGRRKAYWVVYSQNFQKIETFEYGEKEAAEKKAAELTESKKMLHFVKLDKKDII